VHFEVKIGELVTAALKRFTDDELQLKSPGRPTFWGVGHPNPNFWSVRIPRTPTVAAHWASVYCHIQCRNSVYGCIMGLRSDRDQNQYRK